MECGAKHGTPPSPKTNSNASPTSSASASTKTTGHRNDSRGVFRPHEPVPRATTVLGLKHSSQKLALFGALCQDHLRECSQRGGRPRRSWSAIVRHDGERQSQSTPAGGGQ